MAPNGGLLFIQGSRGYIERFEVSFQFLLLVFGVAEVQVLSLPAVAQILKDVETQVEPCAVRELCFAGQ